MTFSPASFRRWAHAPPTMQISSALACKHWPLFLSHLAALSAALVCGGPFARHAPAKCLAALVQTSAVMSFFEGCCDGCWFPCCPCECCDFLSSLSSPKCWLIWCPARLGENEDCGPNGPGDSLPSLSDRQCLEAVSGCPPCFCDHLLLLLVQSRPHREPSSDLLRGKVYFGVVACPQQEMQHRRRARLEAARCDCMCGCSAEVPAPCGWDTLGGGSIGGLWLDTCVDQFSGSSVEPGEDVDSFGSS